MFTMNILTTYMFIIIQLFTIKINIFVRIAFGTLKNLLQQNVHWPCSVPNKLMYHGKFPVEHGRVRTRLLGTPEYEDDVDNNSKASATQNGAADGQGTSFGRFTTITCLGTRCNGTGSPLCLK